MLNGWWPKKTVKTLVAHTRAIGGPGIFLRSSSHVQQNSLLSHTKDLDAPLRLPAQRKINGYRQQYADNQNISFLPVIVSTSTRMHGEFLRLLVLQAHRETEAHFTAAGMSSQGNQSDSFRFKSLQLVFVSVRTIKSHHHRMVTRARWYVVLGAMIFIFVSVRTNKRHHHHWRRRRISLRQWRVMSQYVPSLRRGQLLLFFFGIYMDVFPVLLRPSSRCLEGSKLKLNIELFAIQSLTDRK
jgi:hypothetical protein